MAQAKARARLAKSAVDWAKFAEMTPEWQQPAYRALKARQDAFVTRVAAKPAELPAIDWAKYKSMISTPGVVEALEKAYVAAGAAVPYPKAEADHAAVTKAEAEALEASKEEKKEMEKIVDLCKRLSIQLEKFPYPMTYQEWYEYMPECYTEETNPTIWPHRPQDQPDGNPDDSSAYGMPSWVPNKENNFRPTFKFRDFEPLTHEEEYRFWEFRKAERAVAKLEQQVKGDPALAPKLAEAKDLVAEIRKDLDGFKAAKAQAEKELDDWRAAGCP